MASKTYTPTRHLHHVRLLVFLRDFDPDPERWGGRVQLRRARVGPRPPARERDAQGCRVDGGEWDHGLGHCTPDLGAAAGCRCGSWWGASSPKTWCRACGRISRGRWPGSTARRRMWLRCRGYRSASPRPRSGLATMGLPIYSGQYVVHPSVTLGKPGGMEA